MPGKSLASMSLMKPLPDHLRRFPLFALYLIIAWAALAGVTFAAKYAGEAFTLGAGARGLAMGGAVVAGPFDGTAPYWNPAGMNRLDGRYVTAMHAETFGSLLNHDVVTFVQSRPDTSRVIRAWGAYLYYLGGGGIKITQLDQSSRPYVVREESHGDYLFAFALSGMLRQKIDFGLTGKVIYRDIGTESGVGLTLDAGLLYRWSRRLETALMVSDLTTGVIRYSGKTYDRGATTETIYPTMRPGVIYSYPYRQWVGRMTVSGDLKFENLRSAAQYWIGSLSLDTHYGWEIEYRGLLFGRAGFDRGRFTGGAGMLMRHISVDLAYLHGAELDDSYRVSAGYRF